MKTMLSRVLLVGILLSGVAVPCVGQRNTEAGGFWEFIHKLSGPEFKGLGFSIQVRPFPLRCTPRCQLLPALRASYAVLEVDDDDRAVADSVGLHVLNYQVAAEFPVFSLSRGRVPTLFEVGIGATVHRFRGHAVDNFNHTSFPLYGQANVSTRLTGPIWIGARVAGGWRFFPAFDDDAFRPANVVLDEGKEWVGFYFLGLDLRYMH